MSIQRAAVAATTISGVTITPTCMYDAALTATPRLRTIASQSIVASEPTVMILGPMFVPISVA
jgi:hypothetical protein